MLQELTVQTTYLLRELDLECGRRASEGLAGATAWTKFLARSFYRGTDGPPVFECCVRKAGCHPRNGGTLAFSVNCPYDMPDLFMQLLFPAPRCFASAPHIP
jgi:hypothetical protein